MSTSNNLRRVGTEDLRVSSEARPGWVLGSERVPGVGETVFCASGEGVVTAVLGKTGDGSRLLQIRLEGEKPPFFAASSNVLVAPAAPVAA
ncbi:MAG TPA: hypothetical protein VFQ39_19330 [Longimicrobium sp.]|nr:hypothetical protein [Longimicrobium sp.]